MQIATFVRQLYPTTFAQTNKSDGNECTIPPQKQHEEGFLTLYQFHCAVAALLEFRAALDSGGTLTTWDPSNACSKWIGLTCNSNHFVTKM